MTDLTGTSGVVSFMGENALSYWREGFIFFFHLLLPQYLSFGKSVMFPFRDVLDDSLAPLVFSKLDMAKYEEKVRCV